MTTVGARPARVPTIPRLAVRPSRDRGGRIAAWWPWAIVAAAVVWNLVSLRALSLGVTYLNDASLHEQMVRFATTQLRSGHLPLTSWFPYLGLGSPQFLHYQSLPALLTGALGLLIGPDPAFRWSLYLLLSLWPISVYLSARLFGAGRPAAAASAAMAPFVVSATGVGYEQHAYVWSGFGVWTQLWASWTLPLAWGLSWRAIGDGRGYLAAVLLTAVTVALHFETGYLALSVLLVWPLVAGGPRIARLCRAAVVLGGSLFAAAWVIVPLLAQRDWAATNEILRGTPLENGYGAGRVLDWLVSGQLLDHGRLPVVTLFAALGLGLACRAWSSDANGRALLVALAACLVLAFGRQTFGSLVDLIPGSADLFFRRFTMGVQLAALLLAGRGAGWLAARCVRTLEDRIPRRPPGLSAGVVLVAAIAVLAPAWLQLGAYDRHDAAAISAQRRADATHGAELDRILGVIARNGGGRTYAGMPSNWGQDFTVGAVPVFKYLDSRDVDEVGYTLRTASLMTDPEYYFDERNAGDYRLFGIRYLIIPAGAKPSVPARLELRAGPYALWTLPDAAGVVHAGRIAGTLSADRSDIGLRSILLLNSRLAQAGDYLRVGYDQSGGREPRLRQPSAATSPGTVVAQSDELQHGLAAANVRMRQAGVVVLSASFDAGWTATVDGRPQRTEMVAPALVATAVPAGTHHVVFRYRGWRDYPLLFALGAASLAALATRHGANLMRSLGSRMRTSVAVDGFQLAYDRSGSGAGVLLLHGWPGDRMDYRDVVALLAGNADVVVPDLRGFGESDKHRLAPSDAYTAAAQARSVVALIDELELGQVVIVGYDVGSRVAQAVARQSPERVRALVVSPPLPGALRSRSHPGGPAGVLVSGVSPTEPGRGDLGRTRAGDPRVHRSLLVTLVRPVVRAGGRRPRSSRARLRGPRSVLGIGRLVPRRVGHGRHKSPGADRGPG